MEDYDLEPKTAEHIYHTMRALTVATLGIIVVAICVLLALLIF